MLQNRIDEWDVETANLKLRIDKDDEAIDKIKVQIINVQSMLEVEEKKLENIMRLLILSLQGRAKWLKWLLMSKDNYLKNWHDQAIGIAGTSNYYDEY